MEVYSMSMEQGKAQYETVLTPFPGDDLLENLTTALRSGHTFSEAEVIQIGLDISDELMLRHKDGITHGNIKPETVFVDSYGIWKLGSFPASGADVREDICGLGQVLSWLRSQNPVSANASDGFAAVIAKACAPDPKDRYQTAYSFFIALNRLAAAAPMTGERYVPNKKATKAAAPKKPETGTTPQNKPETKSPPEVRTDTAKDTKTNINGDTNRDTNRDGGTNTANGTTRKKPKAALWIILAVFAVIASLAGTLLPIHIHSWADATCAYPKYCTECGKTKGEALAHTETKATCTEPGVCTVCGAVVAAPTGHLWQGGENGSRYCVACGEPEGMSVLEMTLAEAKGYAEADRYREAIRLLDNAWKNTGDRVYYDFAAEYRMAFGISNASYIAAGRNNSVLITDTGTLVVMGDDEFHELDARYWSDITAVSAGDRHIVGLRSDGTVVSAGSNDLGQRDVGSWTDVVAIAAGDVHTIALRADGTLLAAGQLWAPRCDVDTLHALAGDKRIVSVAAGYLHTLALLEDGTVIASGENGRQQCDVSGWTDIAAIYAGSEYSLGLKTDGTVVMAGISSWDVSGWMNIANLAAGDYFAVGVTEEGTLLSAGVETAIGPNTPYTIGAWTGIAQVSAGTDHIVTLTADGRTRCAGKNDKSQINMDGFTVTYPR